ncbi:MAG: ribonuclease [Lachnospiraceae bacterium]|nr:ribonuclease [Lachnospiraceae bacterium]
MKLKKNLRTLLCYLLLAVMSLTLLTGCTPEETELAADVLTAVLTEDLETEDKNEQILSEESEDILEEDILIEPENTFQEESVPDTPSVTEEETYTTKKEVAEYIHEYGHLPSNFITKKEAKKLGWVSSEGNLDEVAPGMSIGGDYFGNYEGLLPEAVGRDYYECDIDFDGTYRNAKRIIYSTDGLIYYTEDHYESFELLYGEE